MWERWRPKQKWHEFQVIMAAQEGRALSVSAGATTCHCILLQMVNVSPEYQPCGWQKATDSQLIPNTLVYLMGFAMSVDLDNLFK